MSLTLAFYNELKYQIEELHHIEVTEDLEEAIQHKAEYLANTTKKSKH